MLSWLGIGGAAATTDPEAVNNTEAQAGQYLTNLEAQLTNGAHFVSRHGAQTTLEEQWERATTGLTPDGVLGNPVNSSRFLSNVDQLASLQEAQRINSQTGQNAFDFEMPNAIGEGFTQGGNELVTTSNVQAVFRGGDMFTLFPKLKPLQ